MNHVIIGLGGTGGKVVRALRRLIYAEFLQETPPGVGLGFLYVDSSREMMAADYPSWKLLGTSVQLPVASQLLITGEDLQSRLDSIQTDRGRRARRSEEAARPLPVRFTRSASDRRVRCWVARNGIS